MIKLHVINLPSMSCVSYTINKHIKKAPKPPYTIFIVLLIGINQNNIMEKKNTKQREHKAPPIIVKSRFVKQAYRLRPTVAPVVRLAAMITAWAS